MMISAGGYGPVRIPGGRRIWAWPSWVGSWGESRPASPPAASSPDSPSPSSVSASSASSPSWSSRRCPGRRSCPRAHRRTLAVRPARHARRHRPDRRGRPGRRDRPDRGWARRPQGRCRRRRGRRRAAAPPPPLPLPPLVVVVVLRASVRASMRRWVGVRSSGRGCSMPSGSMAWPGWGAAPAAITAWNARAWVGPQANRPCSDPSGRRVRCRWRRRCVPCGDGGSRCWMSRSAAALACGTSNPRAWRASTASTTTMHRRSTSSPVTSSMTGIRVSRTRGESRRCTPAATSRWPRVMSPAAYACPTAGRSPPLGSSSRAVPAWRAAAAGSQPRASRRNRAPTAPTLLAARVVVARARGTTSSRSSTARPRPAGRRPGGTAGGPGPAPRPPPAPPRGRASAAPAGHRWRRRAGPTRPPRRAPPPGPRRPRRPGPPAPRSPAPAHPHQPHHRPHGRPHGRSRGPVAAPGPVASTPGPRPYPRR